jgi:cytosine/adenosine deaminase-related metal-dependent hydrolase
VARDRIEKMIYTGKFLIPRPGEVITRGALCVDDDRIAAVGKLDEVVKEFPRHKVREWPDALITPGLVNAHCHLELEFCAGKVEYDGNFIDWLQRVRDLKHDFMVLPGYYPETSIKAIIASGTTTLLDHYTMEMDFRAIEEAGLRYFGFRELFDFNNHCPDERRLREASVFSYAVHSPYTASAEIARSAFRIAHKKGLPISMHLAEMPQELEFIFSHNEDIERLLRRAGAYDESWHGTGKSPVAYFDSLGILSPRTYCVHLNYVSAEDIELLAGRNVTHVYCPRSHAYFMHPEHPLPHFQVAGINSCLGTDSYGSNIDLNVLGEAKLMWAEFPKMPAATVFAMVTTNGLKPLRLDGELGKLERGYRADLAVYTGCDAASFDEIVRWLVNRKSAALVVREGRVIHEG